MQGPRVINRWLVVGGAILIQLCLGAIYAWSVFTRDLTAPTGSYQFSAGQSQWVFSAGLASFAGVMLLAGRWQARIGPRRVAAMGGVVLGASYVLGGFFGRTFVGELICIGLIGGAGIGMAYVVPIAVGVKWFPDKKGMITGLAVAGFGFGAMIWVKLAGSWFGGLLNTVSLFGLPGVQSVFIIYGITFLALILLGSIVMVNPPEGWHPPGWQPECASQVAATATPDIQPAEMVRTPQYWALLFMMIGSATAGLMVIGCIRLFGMDSLIAGGAATSVAHAGKIAGTAMAAYAIFNGLGRIAWGMASDHIGRKVALEIMCIVQAATMLTFFHIGGTQVGLIVGACVIGFNFGGNFALFPAATADLFGSKHIGANYPWVFLAYGLAGIIGPQIAGAFKDAAAASGAGVEAWRPPFMIAGVACLIAAGIAVWLHAPAARSTNLRGTATPRPA